MCDRACVLVVRWRGGGGNGGGASTRDANACERAHSCVVALNLYAAAQPRQANPGTFDSSAHDCSVGSQYCVSRSSIVAVATFLGSADAKRATGDRFEVFPRRCAADEGAATRDRMHGADTIVLLTCCWTADDDDGPAAAAEEVDVDLISIILVFFATPVRVMCV